MNGPRARLAAVALLALAVRVVYAILNRHHVVQGDALAYHLEGAFLAHGQGFREPYAAVPTAEHPPLHIVVVAFVDLLGGSSLLAQRLALCVVGTVTVVLIALVARRLGGERLGLVAGVIAAGYPMLWLPDGALMSETTYGVFVAGALLAALRVRERPTAGRAAALGAVIALAALTRGEALGLLVLLAAPLLWRRWRSLAVAVLAFAVVIAPWTIRNLATFERPVLISTNSDGVWAGANCHATYYTSQIGAWRFDCYGSPPPGDESERMHVYRTRGVDYMRDHLSRLPLVLLAREGRLWDVYEPWTQGVFYAASEGRNPTAQRLGLLCYWLLLGPAIAGAWLLRRRRGPLWVLAAPLLLAALTGAVTYGTTRFRFVAEPSLVLLGAVAVEAALARLRAASSARASSVPASATATSVSAGISQSQSIAECIAQTVRAAIGPAARAASAR